MKTEGLKTKLYAGVVTVLLLTTVTGTAALYDKQGGLQAGINQEKLNSEKLLSEKLVLDKEIASLNKKLSILNGKNTELAKELDNTNNKANEQVGTIGKLQKENNSLKGLVKEVNALKLQRDQLQVELASLKEASAALTHTNGQLGQTIAQLQAENDALKDKLKTAAVLKAGNFRIEVLRKNAEKLTVKGKHVKKVSVSFDLPKTAMASMGKSKVYLVITGPDGKTLTATDVVGKTVYPEGIKTQITPNATQEVDLGKGPQRLTIGFEPQQDMVKGIYLVELYTDDMYLGNSQFKLM